MFTKMLILTETDSPMIVTKSASPGEVALTTMMTTMDLMIYQRLLKTQTPGTNVNILAAAATLTWAPHSWLAMN